MRTSKAFLSCTTVAAAALLLVATAPMATGGSHDHDSGGSVPTAAPGPPPTSCSTGLFSLSVSRGPSFVSCTPTSTNPSGQCTEIEYTVTDGGTPDHVAAVEGVGIQYVTGPGNQFYAPCKGDPVTDLGENSCHEQAAKFNPNSSANTFAIGLAGERKPGPTTVATRKGLLRLGQCTILGIGLEGVASPDQTTQTTENINFKGCVVQFTRDPATGEVVKAQLLTDFGDSGIACESPTLNIGDKTIDPKPVGEIEVFVAGKDLGPGKFGDGFVSTGNDSCTTRVIGGKVYTWGTKPCP